MVTLIGVFLIGVAVGIALGYLVRRFGKRVVQNNKRR